MTPTLRESLFARNPFKTPWSCTEAQVSAMRRARQCHTAMDEYAPTPLIHNAALAGACGIGALAIKDESTRFGLNAFKVLGPSFAVSELLNMPGAASATDSIFATASAGNHGRAVAWIAGKLGAKAVVFMAHNTTDSRIEAIEREGARVEVVVGDYDAAVSRCADMARREGWTIISDMAYPGYSEIPEFIVAGYATMFREVEEQWDDAPPEFVLVQAGCGGLASAVCMHYAHRHPENFPRIVCVEPLDSACCLASILTGSGTLTSIAGADRSMMAGLNCGTPSTTAWPILKSCVDSFIAIDDEWSRRAMRLFREHADVTAGESGAAGLGALLAVRKDSRLRDHIGLGDRSRVLILNTEGATDPENYERIVHSAG